MAITFPITAVTTTYSGTRSPSFTLGTSPVENDIIVAFVSSTTTSSAADVTGWNNVLGSAVEVMPSDTTLAVVMVWHVVTAAEDTANQVSWTLTNLWDATETGRITVTVLRGADTTSPVVSTGSDSSAVNTGTPFYIGPYATGLQVPGTIPAYIIAGVAGDGTATLANPASHYTVLGGAGATQTNYLYRSASAYNSNGGVSTGIPVTPSTGDEWATIAAAFRESFISISGSVGTVQVAGISGTLLVDQDITGSVADIYLTGIAGVCETEPILEGSVGTATLSGITGIPSGMIGSPEAPTSLSGTPEDSQVVLTWTAPSGVVV